MLSCNLPLAVLADDRDLLRAAEAVTRGWNGYRNKTETWPWRTEKTLPPLLLGLVNLDHKYIIFQNIAAKHATAKESSLPLIIRAVSFCCAPSIFNILCPCLPASNSRHVYINTNLKGHKSETICFVWMAERVYALGRCW